jgi:hypothetical protein
MNERPDTSGMTDRTQYLGSRLVTADITALSTVKQGRVDEIASAFGPYMDPSVRPTLHYVLDRADNPERTLTLRGSAFAWPISGPYQRDIQLQWVAPFPLAIDPAGNLATAYPGTGIAGRTYNWLPPREYPSGSGTPVSARVVTKGDTWTRPTLRIYGPISGAQVYLQPDTGNVYGLIPFLASFNIDAGHYVTVDTDAHTAVMDDDPTQSVLANLDWWNLRWPVLTPGNGSTMSISASSGAIHSTQVQATWYDRYFA